jgi:hypothetical protein
VLRWAILAVQVKKLHLRGRPRQREDLVDLAWAAGHDQALAGAAGADARIGDDPRGGGVHEGDFAHVEHDQGGERRGFLEYPFEFWTTREMRIRLAPSGWFRSFVGCRGLRIL